MQDTKLFETILGITTPWHVARVTLKPEDERVDVWLEHEPTRWPCPDCGETVPAFDHAAERTWRHLDTCQFQTHLHAKIPRVQCPAHGVKQVRVPWAEPRSRFTVLLERLIIDLILQCSTVKGACEIAGVSWDEAWGVMSRAVARGHARKAARPITYIGVDEKAFRKGHRYHTIVCDLQRATVEFVAEDRKTESLAAYYAQLTDAQRRALHAVAMDMWEAYIGATRDGLPDGAEKIVFDRFHIMREMTKAVGAGPAPQGFLGHLIAREYSQEECRNGEARSRCGGGGGSPEGDRRCCRERPWGTVFGPAQARDGAASAARRGS